MIDAIAASWFELFKRKGRNKCRPFCLLLRERMGKKGEPERCLLTGHRSFTSRACKRLVARIFALRNPCSDTQKIVFRATYSCHGRWTKQEQLLGFQSNRYLLGFVLTWDYLVSFWLDDQSRRAWASGTKEELSETSGLRGDPSRGFPRPAG